MVAFYYVVTARALRTLLLLQAAPLKYALAQTRHCVPDSQAGPSRRVNEVLLKVPYRIAHISNIWLIYTSAKWKQPVPFPIGGATEIVLKECCQRITNIRRPGNVSSISSILFT